MDINSELLEIVRKNLPEATAGELKNFITQAEQDKKDLIRTLQEKADLTKRNSELIIQTANQNKKIQTQEETDKKLVDIEKRERNLKVTCLEMKLEESNKRADIVKELTKTVFSNQDVVISKSGFVPIFKPADQYNCNSGVEQHCTNEESTIKKVKW